jgi:hypothetical protein
MDTTIIAALIGAIGAVVASVIAVFLTRLKKSRKKNLRNFRRYFFLGSNLAKLSWGKLPGSLEPDVQRSLEIRTLEMSRALGLPERILGEIRTLLDGSVTLEKAIEIVPDLRNLITLYLGEQSGALRATAFYLGFNIVSAVVMCDIASLSPDVIGPVTLSILREIKRDAAILGFNVRRLAWVEKRIASGCSTDDYAALRQRVVEYSTYCESQLRKTDEDG